MHFSWMSNDRLVTNGLEIILVFVYLKLYQAGYLAYQYSDALMFVGPNPDHSVNKGLRF